MVILGVMPTNEVKTEDEVITEVAWERPILEPRVVEPVKEEVPPAVVVAAEEPKKENGWAWMLVALVIGAVVGTVMGYIVAQVQKSSIRQAQDKNQNSMVIVKPTPGPTATSAAEIMYQTTTPKAKVRSTMYVTLVGSGNTMATNWEDVEGSDFSFNPADYPGLVAVYFEANMKLMTGSGRAYVRLFDVTRGIGVQGSEASTQAGIDTMVESGQASFWAGKNLIRVQIKSLTTESTVYNSGRLRIVTEN